MTRVRAAAAAAVLTSSLLFAGCSGGGLSDTGEPLTIEQSELLSQARFQLGAAETFTAEVRVGDPEAVDYYAADLTVSTADHLAWGVLHRGPADLAVDEPLRLAPEVVAMQSDGQWRSGPVHGAGYGVFAPLTIVFTLSTDRPENAQLLRQTDAAYLGDESVDGESLQVYRLADADGEAGTTRLWLTGEGGLRRLDSSDGRLTIDISAGEAGAPRPADLEQVLGHAAETGAAREGDE